MPNRSTGTARFSGKTRWLVAGVLALPLIAGACEEKNTYVAPPPPKVTVAQPIQKPVTEYLEFTGNIAAVQTVELRARVEGYLEQVLFEDGDLVKKGDLLFQIEQAPYIAAVDQAKANVARAQADLTQARLTADRRRQAGRTRRHQPAAGGRGGGPGGCPGGPGDASLKAALETAELNLGYTKVYAPFDGRIGRRLVDPGNLVGAGEDTLLAEINQIEPVYVYFTISERALLPIMERQKSQDPGAEASKKTQPLIPGTGHRRGLPAQGFSGLRGDHPGRGNRNPAVARRFPEPGSQACAGPVRENKGARRKGRQRNSGSPASRWLRPAGRICDDRRPGQHSGAAGRPARTAFRRNARHLQGPERRRTGDRRRPDAGHPRAGGDAR